MESPCPVSIGDLAEQLLTDRLIESCELTNDRVTIVQASTRHTFPYDQARSFMKGMLRGRSWGPEGRPGGDGEASGDGAGSLTEPHVAASPSRVLRSALDDLASTALEMDLIARCDHVENGSVKIALSSCESEMPAEDALAFLADCVADRLKTLGEALVPIRGGV